MGCYHYGWGAILPALIIRYVIGFRESDDLQKDQFILAPALPSSLFRPGHTYGLSNLRYRQTRTDVLYEVKDDGKIMIRLTCRLLSTGRVMVKNEAGQMMAQTTGSVRVAELSFEGINGTLYTITIERG